MKVKGLARGKEYAKEVAEKNAIIKKLQKKLRVERAKLSKLNTPGKLTPVDEVPKQ